MKTARRTELRGGPKTTGRSLACLVLAAGCGGGWGMMQPTDVIQASEELPIRDRSSWSGSMVDESFGLGSYKVADVDRKWTSSSSQSYFSFESTNITGGYAFKVLDGEQKLKGECATETSDKSKNLGGGAALSNVASKLGCRCADGGTAATLTVQTSTGNQYEGQLVAPEMDFKVAGIHQRARGSSTSDAMGYRVDSATGPIGAVELKKPGRVWISKAVEGSARQQIACLFAGLLLYNPPTDRDLEMAERDGKR